MTSLIFVLFLSFIKQIDYMLHCVFSVTDHGREKNVTRTLVTYSSTLYRFRFYNISIELNLFVLQTV